MAKVLTRGPHFKSTNIYPMTHGTIDVPENSSIRTGSVQRKEPFGVESNVLTKASNLIRKCPMFRTSCDSPVAIGKWVIIIFAVLLGQTAHIRGVDWSGNGLRFTDVLFDTVLPIILTAVIVEGASAVAATTVTRLCWWSGINNDTHIVWDSVSARRSTEVYRFITR